MKRFSALVTSIALLAALPATARADILWDLMHDAGSGGDYGVSKALLLHASVCGPTNLLTCGSITASSQTTVHVFGNDFTVTDNNGNGPLGAYNMQTQSERGLGMCIPGTNCAGEQSGFQEIGIAPSPATGPLFLDLTGVLNSGALNAIWMTSLQTTEGYLVEYSTTTIGGSYTTLCSGAGANNGFTDIARCDLTGAQQAAGIKYLKFTSTNLDFSVQALRFNSVVPEPGTMVLLATGLVALTGAGFVRRRNKK